MAVGAGVVIGLLLWSICSGKLMLVDTLWAPMANTAAVEFLVDLAMHVAEVAVEAKHTAAQKWR